MNPAISDEQWRALLTTRSTRPEAVAEAYARRTQRARLLTDRGTLFLMAADHPARGALRAGSDPVAMADRRSLMDRLVTALSHPDVDGVLGSPDIVEDLLLLGALEGKVVIGSMNRGGLDGASWTIDDRFTGYDAAGIAGCRLDGGKMLLRIDDNDPATASTLQACAQAVTELADRKLIAMVEPLPYRRDASGALVLQQDAAALSRAFAIASALGRTSAYTWLKTPACNEPEQVYATTTLPCVVLGGVPGPDFAEQVASWGRTLRQPVVRGLVVGRTVLYPDGGDVFGTVDAAAKVLRAATENSSIEIAGDINS
ncbi:MAG: Cgl0159 family (beta/alpha)8-fold protein [Jatrophihabitans sp.]